MTTIYNKDLHVKYSAPPCSIAMMFHCLSIAVMVLVPILVGAYTRNLWVSDMSYMEQPDVQFKYKLLAFITDKGGASYTWSSYSVYNTLTQDMVSVPSVSVIETDGDRDGRVDQFNITLQFSNSDITSTQLLLVFQYQLSAYCNLAMETPIFIQQAIDNNNLVLYGDLVLKQTESLQPYTPNTDYNISLIQHPNIVEEYDIKKILGAVSARPFRTTLETLYTLTSPAATFTATYIINIPSHIVRYEPGFWEAVKYAWMQYIALFVITYTVVGGVRRFVFENMIVTSSRRK